MPNCAFFTAATFRQAADKSDREEYSKLAEQHQVIWKEARERKDLERVCLPQVDLEAKPLTMVERLFLDEVFIYFESGWKLALKNIIPEREQPSFFMPKSCILFPLGNAGL